MKKLLIVFLALSIAAAMGLTAYGAYRNKGENLPGNQTCINYENCEASTCSVTCEPSTDGTGKQNGKNQYTNPITTVSSENSAGNKNGTYCNTTCEYSTCANNGEPVTDGTGLQYGKQYKSNNSSGENVNGKCYSNKCGHYNCGGEYCTNLCEPSTDGSGNQNCRGHQSR